MKHSHVQTSARRRRWPLPALLLSLAASQLITSAAWAQDETPQHPPGQGQAPESAQEPEQDEPPDGETEESTPGEAQAARDAEARALFDAAQVALSNGELERALEYFQRAYELSHRPELLFNVASMQDRLRMDAEALESYRAYLATEGNAERAAYAQGRVRALEASGGAETSGGPDRTTSEATESGTTVSVSPPVVSDDAGGDIVPGAVLLGVGGALILGAVGTLVYWLDRSSVADECDALGGLNCPTLESERDLGAGLTVALGLTGAALVVTGAVLAATAGSGDESEASVRCLPSLGGVACAGRF